MARLPSSADISGPENMRSGRAIAKIDTTAIGRGIASLGNSISAVGEEWKQQENAVDLSRAEAIKTKGLLDTQNQFSQDGDYSTFLDRAPKQTSTVIKDASNVIRDPKMREKWAAGAETDAIRTNDSIEDHGRTLAKQAETTAFDDALETNRRIFVDPNVPTAQQEKAKADIEGSIQMGLKSGLLTPTEADARRKAYIENANFSRAKLYAGQYPNSVLAGSKVTWTGQAQPKGEMASLVAKEAQAEGVDPAIALGIVQIESGFNPSAKAGTSSASGLYQFTTGTGNQYGLTEPHNAEANAKAGAQLTRDNINGLKQSLGREPSPGEIYLAHFSGFGAAQKLGQANDNTPTSEIFSPEAIAANKSILAGKTAGQVKQWADRKMADAMRSAAGVDVAVTPGADQPSWFKDLSPEQRQVVDQVAEAKRQENATAQSTILKAQQNTAKDNYNLRIATADPTLTPQSILTDPIIDNGDKATLIESLNSKNKDLIFGAHAVQSYADGTLQVDPYSPDGKKAVNAIGDAIMKNVPQDQQQSATEGLIKTTGLVPQKTFNGIRAGLESTNVADIEAAAQQAQRISTINPAALSRSDGGSGVQKVADDFGYYTNTLNLSPTEAAQRIANANDPAKLRERKVLEPAAKEFRKQIEQEDLASMFDDTIRPFDKPSLGFDEGQALGIQADYMAIAEEQFYQSNGNVDIAKNRAKEEMKRLYGVSTMSGDNVVMKHPPERYWPVIAGDTSLQYAKTQLYQDLHAIDPAIADAKVQIVTTPATDAMVKRGEMPGYAVFYKDKNGVMQTMPGKLWRPDPTVQLQMQDQRAKDAQNKLTDSARFTQGIERTQAEMANDPEGARAAAQDSFLAGPASTPQDTFKKNGGGSVRSPAAPSTPSQSTAPDDTLNIDPMRNSF